MVPDIGAADTIQRRRYVIPNTGANVDIRVSIFTEDAGSPEDGIGRRFFTQDRRADLTLQSVPNPGNDSPVACWHSIQASDATFLRCVQHSKRLNLVQSLQPRQRIHALRVDQLAGGGGSTVGRGRHPVSLSLAQ